MATILPSSGSARAVASSEYPVNTPTSMAFLAPSISMRSPSSCTSSGDAAMPAPRNEAIDPTPRSSLTWGGWRWRGGARAGSPAHGGTRWIPICTGRAARF
uniref:Uncharacterized protein n=1 Tax=Arundo donax TaxID=35708 RepID=A0A0A9HI57_ARUDO